MTKNNENNAPEVEVKSSQNESWANSYDSDKNVNKHSEVVEKKEEVSTQQTFDKKETKNSNNWVKVLILAVISFFLLVLLILGIVALVTRIFPKVDKNMDRPILKVLPEYTNKSTVNVEGTAKNVDSVIIYVDGKVWSTVKVKDNRFEKEFTFTTEKKYTFEAAGVKGFILRTRSDKSDSVTVTFDKTAPSSKIEFLDTPTETNLPKVDLKGKAEPGATVILKKDDREYTGEVTDEGRFSISGLELKSGLNEFSIVIKDAAGNSTQVSEKLSITYKPSATISNSAASTNSQALPNSAGPLEDAIVAVFENNATFVLGLVAFFVLLLNSGIVVYKLNKRD